ncbi:MAG: penicillin acylase family protein, partial [Thermoanaerobaculia bacterium]
MRRGLIALGIVLLATLPLDAQNLNQWTRLPGMRSAGQITRDANGVPYIRALSDYDAVFLNGWVHAQDRLFQMDENRRTAHGTLAELLGTPALSSDVQ